MATNHQFDLDMVNVICPRYGSQAVLLNERVPLIDACILRIGALHQECQRYSTYEICATK